MVWLLMLAFQTPNVFMKWPHKGTLLKPSSSLKAMVEFQRHKNHTRLIWSLGRDGWNDLGSVSEKTLAKRVFFEDSELMFLFQESKNGLDFKILLTV